MAIALNELQVYKLKVGLFAHKWGEKQNLFGGGHGMVQPGSQCYLDQVTESGWAVFHLFGEECKGLYVTLPSSYADDQLEIVLDANDRVVMVEQKAGPSV